MPLRFGVALSLAIVALTLIACGEDSETVRVTDRYTLDMLGAGVSLTEERCDSARMGQLLYVGDSSSIYYCTGKVWKKINGSDGRDGRDGKDGADGTDGKRGKYGTSGNECSIDGFSEGFVLGCGATKAVVRYDFEIPDTCSIKFVADSSYVLTCGDESVTLIQGPQGAQGASCVQTDIGGGRVKLACGNDSVTTYKAQCGETPFDPDGSQFCYGDTLVERCNMHIYDIQKQFCYSDSLVDLCGGSSYDLKHQFCYSDSVVNRCKGKIFDLALNFCHNDTLLLPLCGGERYDYDFYRCVNEENIPRCPKELGEKEFCDERNGMVYRYTIIGEQTWMAQNLDYKVADSYCESRDHDNDYSCGETGRYYPWHTAMARSVMECGYGHECPDVVHPYQGICPDGWHLPSVDEWETLIQIVGVDTRGYWDKSVGLYNGHTHGEDEFGFSAIPAGILWYTNHDGEITISSSYRTEQRLSVQFWTSDEFDAENVYLFYVFADGTHYNQIKKIYYRKSDFARSVRCVKD